MVQDRGDAQRRVSTGVSGAPGPASGVNVTVRPSFLLRQRRELDGVGHDGRALVGVLGQHRAPQGRHGRGRRLHPILEIGEDPGDLQLDAAEVGERRAPGRVRPLARLQRR